MDVNNHMFVLFNVKVKLNSGGHHTIIMAMYCDVTACMCDITIKIVSCGGQIPWSYLTQSAIQIPVPQTCASCQQKTNILFVYILHLIVRYVVKYAGINLIFTA